MSERGENLTVVALGGNALLDPALPPTVSNQFAVTTRAMKPVADLIERGERLVLTHGNGPQVGFMALRSEIAAGSLHEVPLDSLVADTQGAIGYMLQRALREELRLRGLRVDVVAIVTEVEVDPHDHSFDEPTKPIGAFHREDEVELLERERGWTMVEDAHRGWRRVVPSPAPVDIVQLGVIQRLVEQGVVVICCGGGGIPVTRDPEGHIVGVEGVVDKDRASALLAIRLQAKRLALTTAVDGIYQDFLTDSPRLLRDVSPRELREFGRQGQFPAGSMGPKVKACVRFVEQGGSSAVVCRPDQLVSALAGDCGTRVRLAPPKENP